MDWNPVVHMLDELREGTRSLLELSNAISRYDHASFAQSLLYLADRELIELSASQHPSEPLPREEWRRRLREAFESGNSDPLAMANMSIDLSKRGEQVLRLFGIGYP